MAVGRGQGEGRVRSKIFLKRFDSFFNIYADSSEAGGFPVEKQDCGMDRWGWVVMNAYHVRCTRWGIRPRPKQERLLVEVIETFLVIQRVFVVVCFLDF